MPQAVAANSSKGTILYEDNEATCAIARTASHREATKHLAIARYFVWYHHEHGTVCLADCTTQNHWQVTDFFTKSLGAKLFKQLTDDAMDAHPMLSKDKYAHCDWKSEYDSKYSVVDKPDPDDTPGGMLKSMSAHMSKKDTCKAIVSLLHMNSMIVDTIVAQESIEYVCADIEDFLKMEGHHNQLVTSGQI